MAVSERPTTPRRDPVGGHAALAEAGVVAADGLDRDARRAASDLDLDRRAVERRGAVVQARAGGAAG